MKNSYTLAKQFMKKYPMTVAWRIKKHCKVIDEHIDAEEEILYVFVGQKNDRFVDMFNTYVLAFTNKRIIVATKRVLFGYFFKSITPDMYNDLTVYRGLIWGKVIIDTVKEVITITNLDVKSLDEIDANITDIVLMYKKEYGIKKSATIKK